MKIGKRVAILVAATAMAAGATITAQASPAENGLQRQADALLPGHSRVRHVTADRVDYDGLTVTRPTGKDKITLDCQEGHLCMLVRGTKFDLYKCQTWQAQNWTGNGEFNNNQTPGTVAKFFNQNGSVRWTSTAKQVGTATWDPIYSIRPC
ncbi:hypothetical protein [Streptomyces celluloflavus]|uniref:hypothetical protein n=1 Tax=Streptomyces celluloflavus TaxID=58344 RepID=UPI00368A76E1